MFTTEEISEIVSQVKYLDWKLEVRVDAFGTRPYLQVFGHGPDPKQDMRDEQWSGRKWWLSPHMCKNEIIRTALKAIECAVAHEMYENILYRGYAVFTPHMDYDEIVKMMRERGGINSREGGMQGV